MSDVCDNCFAPDPTWHVRDDRVDETGFRTTTDYWFCSGDCAVEWVEATS